VFDVLAAETTLHPGGIAGHFHVSVDGTRVLNYAEWVDEASHVQAVGDAGSIGRAPAWRRVQTMPGVVNLGFRRYRPYLTREGSNPPGSDV
jgi:adenine deaminase